MKQLLILWILCIIGITSFTLLQKSKRIAVLGQTTSPLTLHTQVAKKSPREITFRGLFVPYWTIRTSDNNFGTYDSYIYFGLAPDANGINTKDSGYIHLPDFISAVPSDKQKLLTITMTDQSITGEALQNEQLQQRIITDALAIAKKNHFTGIVLDLEYTALAFDSITQEITDFNQRFATTTHTNNMQFFVTAYGDTFYRGRPYDVTAIAKNSDGVFIMAYDFHKAKGDPGPNFPLYALADEDYDFTHMIADFANHVETNKLIVTFGLFGYDWQVTPAHRSIAQGKSRTEKDISLQLLPSCSPIHNCIVTRDAKAAETRITYTDTDNSLHDVWYEDQASVAQKTVFLQSQGIGAIGFWAYTYF